MEKIKKYMDKTLTLKDLLRWMTGIVTSLAFLSFTWLKTHEDKQDAVASDNSEKINKVVVLVRSNEQNSKNNKEAISKINTLIEKLVDSDANIKKTTYENQKTIIEQLGDIKGDIKVLKAR